MNARSVIGLRERIVARTIESETGCLEWQGGKQKGYGKISVNGAAYRAHRIMCELENGPAPEDKPMALHKCNNKACVRGDHLYWGDYRDNMRDTIADGMQVSRYRGVERCVQGHEFTPENTYMWSRKSKPHVVERHCRACQRARSAAWMRAKRAAA